MKHKCCKVGTFECQQILHLPENIATEKQNRSISCDVCIADTIKHLWSKNIQTLGCCCGHGKENPSVIIANGNTDVDVLAILLTILQIDERDWDILQWKLNKVG